MRGRGAIGAIIIVVGIVLGVAPAAALAAPRDVASTHAYIRADYALASASEAKVKPAEAKIQALNRKLAGECPNVGAGSPEDEASQPVSHAVIVALWSISYGADAGPINVFADAVRHLRWSSPKLTHMAQSYAASLQELATLPLPSLCNEVRSWKASGFKVIPAATASLVQRAEQIKTKAIPARLLAPYEQPADRSVEARTMHLEVKLEEAEIGVGLTDWDQMLATLGLNQ
jgi:hypothetical protein